MADIPRGNPNVKAIDNVEFTRVYHPGATTPFSGIYRCRTCGWEAVSTVGHPLPPSRAKHTHAQPVTWSLLVAASHATA